MENSLFVYILASDRNGTLYVGYTGDLPRRVYQHKFSELKCFTAKYKVNILVYYEECGDEAIARQREKRLKTWKRQWKIELIESVNPNWIDLYDEIVS